MENRKSKLLLVAFILGIVCFIGLCVLLWHNYYIMPDRIFDAVNETRIEGGGQPMTRAEFDERNEELHSRNLLIFIYFFGLLIPALVLNILSWLKGGKIKVLIAAILYVLSVVGIPSAVLCFIAFAKLKKAQTGAN